MCEWDMQRQTLMQSPYKNFHWQVFGDKLAGVGNDVQFLHDLIEAESFEKSRDFLEESFVVEVQKKPHSLHDIKGKEWDFKFIFIVFCQQPLLIFHLQEWHDAP